MQKTKLKRILSIILCIVIVAAISLFATGCTDNSTTNPDSTSAPTTLSGVSETPEVIGQGAKMFFFVAEDKEGKETKWEIHTDEDTVGKALVAEGIIEGEDGPYGLYVKTVNGTTLDYDKDGMYWAFYENGEYALAGVDKTEITEGQTYAFRPQK